MSRAELMNVIKEIEVATRPKEVDDLTVGVIRAKCLAALESHDADWISELIEENK